ncbi:thiamine pyrophosphate-binding protein [Roseisalinus antarcticus]|uniref:Acetolactate synthase isozyme 3 large subunit n=1 Tax=Roseisalinus antarcticus TaxID=254357 RepID=A0A1Y5TC94_9RHOB|nr:thiamine pyrophosphate-binding protein [Roseisalinus antarcticus]SLN57137.1 Acetolactate synthase isozyme 3 large subunit [Roseisalinus antarcticus]
MTAEKYGSDLMVEVIRGFGVPYISLNPGASFRGLHDSLVNWDGGGPPLICCQHEKTAIGVAHGYAKVTGRPMAVAVHDLVGLLQSTMGVYYAFHDRVPMLILGGSGPADTARRRPSIDWFHSANVQGNAVRDYVKWDDEPRSPEAVIESLTRAWNIAQSGPEGPVYVSLDADLQEQTLDSPVSAPAPGLYSVPTPAGADPAALDQLAAALMSAKRPVVVAGFAGRDPKAFDLIPELAGLCAAGVIDMGNRLNMPNRHPLNVTGTDAVSEADLVLFLDCKDGEPAITGVDTATRALTSKLAPEARCMAMGFGDIGIRGWSHDFGRLKQLALDVTCDTSSALPELVARCRTLAAGASADDADRRTTRRAELADTHAARWQSWQDEAAKDDGISPVSTGRLARDVWEAVKDHDWVLTAGTCRGWARKIWDFDKPYRHPGDSLGTATQIGISLGVALAHKGSGKLVVDLQPDGDLMFDLGTLWVAAYYEIPMLVVMVNNRAYYNDWAHQEHVAIQRDRPVENAYIGMEIDGPAPDFATIAKAQGWWAEGPITDPEAVRDAVARAAAHVLETGRPALVDVVTQLT